MVDPVATPIVTLIATSVALAGSSVALTIIDRIFAFMPYFIDKIYFSRCIGSADDPTMFIAVALYLQSYIQRIIEENIRVRLSTMDIQLEQGQDSRPLKGQAYLPRAGTYVKFSESIKKPNGTVKTYNIWIKSLAQIPDAMVGICGFQIYTSAKYIEKLMTRIRTFSKLYPDPGNVPLYNRPEFSCGPMVSGARADIIDLSHSTPVAPFSLVEQQLPMDPMEPLVNTHIEPMLNDEYLLSPLHHIKQTKND